METPEIHTLELEFPDPYELEGMNPWKRLIERKRDDQQWIQDHAWMRSYPCWKKMLDWLLVLAYKHLEPVPVIKLGGYIKDSTKNKWETIFFERRRPYKTIEYDHEKALEEIFATPATSL